MNQNMKWNTEELTTEQLLIRCGHHAAHHAGAGFGKARVLEALSLTGSLSQGQLLETLGIRPGSLSELLSRMEEQGLITREKEEEDRRRTVITLTDAGRNESSIREKTDILACLSEEEKEQLTAILQKLRAQWDSERVPGTRRPFRSPHGTHPPRHGSRTAEIQNDTTEVSK